MHLRLTVCVTVAQNSLMSLDIAHPVGHRSVVIDFCSKDLRPSETGHGRYERVTKNLQSVGFEHASYQYQPVSAVPAREQTP